MPTADDIVAFEKRNRLTLPRDYARFLAGIDRSNWHVDKRGMRVKFIPLVATDKSSRSESLETPVNLNESPTPFFKLLNPHLQMWRDFTGQDYFDNVQGDNFTAAQIAQAICIAEDDNGDMLFICQSDGSVWAFFHDGCQVEKLADNFAEYFGGCTLEEK